MKKWATYLLVTFIVAGLHVNAQSPALLKQAKKRYDKHDYQGAAKTYRKAFSGATDLGVKQHLAFQLGETYSRMNQLGEALDWYRDAINGTQQNIDWYLAMARVQLKLNQTEAAMATLAKAKSLRPNALQIDQMIQLVSRWQTQENQTGVELVKAESLNSVQSDYSPVFANGWLYFTSARNSAQSRSMDNRTSESFSALYMAPEQSDGQYGKPVKLAVRSNKNAGVISFDQRNQRVFYTKCNNRKMRCVLLEASFDGITGKIGKPKRVDFIDKKYHFGHPWVQEDGRMLYFVSDKPGGFGGKDLYRVSIREDGSLGIVTNLGPNINSSHDEVFPTTIGDSLLLFSKESDNGFGGLDIYYASLRHDEPGKIKQLPFPFNSHADDFSLSLKESSVEGFLSSNRDAKTNDDIFQFTAFPIRSSISGDVRDEETLLPLANALITIHSDGKDAMEMKVDSNAAYAFSLPHRSTGVVSASLPGYFTESKRFALSDTNEQAARINFLLSKLTYPATISGVVRERETGKRMANESLTLSGPDGMVSVARTNYEGVYHFDSLKPDNIYTVRISKTAYFSESRVCRVPKLTKPMLLNKVNGYDMDFELIPIQEKKELVINNIYYDFDKANLRESSKIELNKLVSMLFETPNVKVQISAHTDTRGTNEYNDKLSAARAQSVVDYLIASGIHPERLIARGFGKRFPVVANARSEDEHQVNRRTTFMVTGSDYVTKQSGQKVTQSAGARLIFRVQFLASSVRRDPEAYFSALKNAIDELQFHVLEQAGIYRYEAGDRYTLSAAEALKNKIAAAGFPDCFIVPYIDGKKVSMQQANEFMP